MRKLFIGILIITSIFICGNAWSAITHGTYRIGHGDGADYATMNAFVADITGQTLTGNVTIIVEPGLYTETLATSIINCDIAGFTLWIRAESFPTKSDATDGSGGAIFDLNYASASQSFLTIDIDDGGATKGTVIVEGLVVRHYGAEKCLQAFYTPSTMTTASTIIIRRNVIKDLTRGVTLMDGDSIAKVYNNYIFDCDNYGIYLVGSQHASSMIANNTVTDNATYGMYVNAKTGNFYNNLTNGNGVDFYTPSAATGYNNICEDSSCSRQYFATPAAAAYTGTMVVNDDVTAASFAGGGTCVGCTEHYQYIDGDYSASPASWLSYNGASYGYETFELDTVVEQADTNIDYVQAGIHYICDSAALKATICLNDGSESCSTELTLSDNNWVWNVGWATYDFQTSPNGGDWTWSDVANLKLKIGLDSDGTNWGSVGWAFIRFYYTDADGNQIQKTITFTDEGNNDFSLASSAAAAIDDGYDIHGLDGDIDGSFLGRRLRGSATTDIGADEYYAAGINYYVRVDGNNSNTGTSNTSGGAWETLANINTTAFNPGDTINLQYGQAWTVAGSASGITLASAGGGLSGRPITIKSSDITQTNPKIDGTDQSANYGVNVNGVDYVTISYINFEDFGSTGGGVVFDNSNNCTIENLSSSSSGGSKGGINMTTDCFSTRITNVTSYSNTYYGIDLTEDSNYDTQVSRCTLYSNGSGICTDRGCIVEDCTIYSNTNQGIEIRWDNNHIRRNNIYSNAVGVQWSCNGQDIHVKCRVYCNLIRANTTSGVDVWYDSDAGTVESYILNNSILDNPIGIAIRDDYDDNVTIKNNIVTNATTYLVLAENGSTGTITSDYNDMYDTGDCFFYKASGARDWTEWKADITGEASSTASDPLFSDAANNGYFLMSGSPCVDTGVDVSAILGCTAGTNCYDYAGTIIPIDSPDAGTVAQWEMGAYEWYKGIEWGKSSDSAQYDTRGWTESGWAGTGCTFTTDSQTGTIALATNGFCYSGVKDTGTTVVRYFSVPYTNPTGTGKICWRGSSTAFTATATSPDWEDYVAKNKSWRYVQIGAVEGSATCNGVLP